MARNDAWVVTIAQGGGLGRLPRAPGTWGSAGGLLLFALLARAPHFGLYLLASGALAALAVPLCHRAAQILGAPDPASVVLDEMVAIPIAFSGLAYGLYMPSEAPPALSGERWTIGCAIFLLFRILDIWKPLGIHRLQSLPGGWGIVVDDLAAGACAALLTLPWALK